MSTVREIRFFPYLRLFLSTLAYFEKDGLGHTIKKSRFDHAQSACFDCF